VIFERLVCASGAEARATQDSDAFFGDAKINEESQRWLAGELP